MKTINRLSSPLTGHDRQRKLTRQSILRIILVSSFIANLLIVYKLIHPTPAIHSVETLSFASLAPVLRGSVLFFLALSVVSLIGIAALDPLADEPVAVIQTDPVVIPEIEPVTVPARIIVFRPDLQRPAMDKQPTFVRE